MPCDYRKYPPNWKSEIRPRILKRAGDKCEKCGVENHTIRTNEDGKQVRIVLTIAHVYDDNPMNCADDNLLALCQRCHLTMDARMHAQHARVTRAAAKSKNNLKLF